MNIEMDISDERTTTFLLLYKKRVEQGQNNKGSADMKKYVWLENTTLNRKS